MSKAARKAFLAAKQTKAMEKLDKMIEEAQEVESQSTNKLAAMRLASFGDDSGDLAAGGCPLFLPPPPPQLMGRTMPSSISDSSICNHGQDLNCNMNQNKYSLSIFLTGTAMRPAVIIHCTSPS